MDLKWLEDFVSLARSGSFSRSAAERHVTQPAFSRRIQALELWLGASLIDRSTYPTTLTTEGQRFRETADEVVHLLQTVRTECATATRSPRQTIAVAALHTLSLTFFPAWFRDVECRTGALGSRLLPDSMHNCLQALVEGGYDVLLTYHHPSVPVLLDPELFPHLTVGADHLVAVASREAAPGAWLGYPRGSFLGRLVTTLGDQAGVPAHTNENAMAEALKFMALAGHGRAWLPRSLVADEITAGRLFVEGPEVPLAIRLYRNRARTRASVEAVWEAAGAMAGLAMSGRHEVF